MEYGNSILSNEPKGRFLESSISVRGFELYWQNFGNTVPVLSIVVGCETGCQLQVLSLRNTTSTVPFARPYGPVSQRFWYHFDTTSIVVVCGVRVRSCQTSPSRQCTSGLKSSTLLGL